MVVLICDARGGDHLNYEHSISMNETGARPKGRPKMRWLDRLKSDMRIYGINQEKASKAM